MRRKPYAWIAVMVLFVLCVEHIILAILFYEDREARQRISDDTKLAIQASSNDVKLAVKALCSIDEKGPVETLRDFADRMEGAITTINDCADVGKDTKDTLEMMAPKLNLVHHNVAAYLGRAPAAPADVSDALREHTSGWPTSEQWASLIKLPSSFACDTSGDAGGAAYCVDGQVYLPSPLATLLTDSQVTHDLLRDPQGPLVSAISGATKEMDESLIRSVDEIKGAVDGPALVREALRKLNEPGAPGSAAPVSAALSDDSLVLTVQNPGPFKCSELQAFTGAMKKDARFDQPPVYWTSVPRGFFATSAEVPTEVAKEEPTRLQLSLVTVMTDGKESQCVARFQVGTEAVRWFSGVVKANDRQLSVRIGLLDSSPFHMVPID